MINIIKKILCLFNRRAVENEEKKESKDSMGYLYCHKTKKREIDPNNRWQCKDCRVSR
jgi:hypothetical protein